MHLVRHHCALWASSIKRGEWLSSFLRFYSALKGRAINGSGVNFGMAVALRNSGWDMWAGMGCERASCDSRMKRQISDKKCRILALASELQVSSVISNRIKY